MEQQAKQCIAPTLAAGEYSDLFEHIVFGKQKTSEQAAEFRLGGARGSFAEIVNHARIGIQLFVLILREVVCLNIVAQAEFPVRRELRARE